MSLFLQQLEAVGLEVEEAELVVVVEVVAAVVVGEAVDRCSMVLGLPSHPQSLLKTFSVTGMLSY